MRGIIEEFMRKHGSKLCALAIIISSVAVDTCRGDWYQPKEPEGLQDFLSGRRK